MAIIAILLTLLMPSLARMRDSAKFLGCVNNLRQIIGASILHAAENEGGWPGPNWGHGNQIGWLYDMGRMDNPEDLKGGQLWTYLGDVRVYRCPSDPQPDVDDPAAVINRPRNVRMITSYMMNGSVANYGGKPFDTARRQYQTHRIGDFKADDVIYWEAWEGATSAGWWHDGSNFPHEGLTWRHFDRASAACADGRVERFRTDDWYELANTAPRPNRLWNSPYTESGRR